MGDRLFKPKLRKKHKEQEKKKRKESVPNICDLPIVLLWEILETLEGEDLFRVSRAHPVLLKATKHLSNKYFMEVECVSVVQPEHEIFAETPEALEILLHGAGVGFLVFNLDARLIDIDRLDLDALALAGKDCDDKAVKLIEKYKPSHIFLERCEYSLTPRLCQALSTTREIALGEVDMELLGQITLWDFEKFDCDLPKPVDDLSTRFFQTIKILLDQRKEGKRPEFNLTIRFKEPIEIEGLPVNAIGDDYPLRFTEHADIKWADWKDSDIFLVFFLGLLTIRAA